MLVYYTLKAANGLISKLLGNRGGYPAEATRNYALALTQRAYEEVWGRPPSVQTVEVLAGHTLLLMKKSGLFKKNKAAKSAAIAAAHNVTVWNRAEIQVLKVLIRHLPKDVGKDATIIMVQGWGLAKDRFGLIQELATVVGSCRGDVMRVMPGWCETVQARLSSIKEVEIDDLPHKHAFPEKWGNKQPVDLINQIFRGTPFVEFLKLRLPVTISDKAFHCMAHGVAEIGGGKTTLTAAAILSCIGNKGIMVFDSKGGLAEELVEKCGRPDLVVAIDMTNPDMRPLFNVAQPPPGTIKDHAAKTIAFVLAGMGIHFTDLQLPTFEMVVRIMSQAENPTINTLLDVLEDEEKARFLAETADPDTQRWFKTQYTSDEIKTSLKQIARKLWGLKSGAMKGELLCGERNTLQLARLLDQRKIVIFTMNKDKVGGDVSLMMRLGLAAVAGALWSRPATPPKRLPDWQIFIDEYGDVEGAASDSIVCDIITQGRQRRVGLWLTHQQIAGQLSPAVEAALLGNAALRFCRNPSEKEAAKIASGMNCRPQDLMGIDEHEDEGRFMLFIRGDIRHAVMATVPFGHLQRRKGLPRAQINKLFQSFLDYWSQQNRPRITQQRAIEAPESRRSPVQPKSAPEIIPPGNVEPLPHGVELLDGIEQIEKPWQRDRGTT